MMLVVLLGGCGHSKTNAEQVTIPKDPKKIKGDITVWAWALEANYLEKDVLPQFNKKYPNVNVRVEHIGVDQVYQKLSAGLSIGGKGLPDLVQVENNRIHSFTNKFKDPFTNLNQLGYDKHEKEFSASKIDGLKDKDGNIIAAPRDLGPVGVIYRTDIFKEAGVDPSKIETWDDYIEAGKKVVAHTGKGFLGTYNDTLLRVLLQEQGKYYFTKDGKLDISSPEARKAAGVIQKMKDAGLITYTNNWDGQVAAMKNSVVATNPGAVWWSGTMLEQIPELSGKWDMFRLPAFEKGGVRASNDGGSALAIPSASKNKAAAYVFAEFATTDIDSQIKGLTNRGLFPSLLAAYKKPELTANQKYFNNQPFFKKFADTVPDILPVNNAPKELDVRSIMTSEFQAFLLENKPAEKILIDGEKQSQRQTGLEVSK
ncbi:sugar ABC transporter substrate-binding protein [Fictibacillus enclensis]|uniref:ABC transporter substrate-binding protein n=1 Tax=Fictibacillus enclensis TaxID=1017270 RepID=UPI0025A05CF0|nr:sugar ABC transporter substrate-binding protein [Fictibacillus enclensis]MDM5337391.1 sugar ABC transporter substrate-binding protein [Fictibacillus enclensis]